MVSSNPVNTDTQTCSLSQSRILLMATQRVKFLDKKNQSEYKTKQKKKNFKKKVTQYKKQVCTIQQHQCWQ